MAFIEPMHRNKPNITSLLTVKYQPSQWRHNGRDGVSNHQPYGCLLNCLFKALMKETSKLRVTGPLWGEFTGDQLIPHTKDQ